MAVAVFAIPVLDEFPSSSSSVAITVIAAGVMLSAGYNSIGQQKRRKHMIRFYFHPTPNPAKVALIL